MNLSKNWLNSYFYYVGLYTCTYIFLLEGRGFDVSLASQNMSPVKPQCDHFLTRIIHLKHYQFTPWRSLEPDNSIQISHDDGSLAGQRPRALFLSTTQFHLTRHYYLSSFPYCELPEVGRVKCCSFSFPSKISDMSVVLSFRVQTESELC